MTNKYGGQHTTVFLESSLPSSEGGRVEVKAPMAKMAGKVKSRFWLLCLMAIAPISSAYDIMLPPPIVAKIPSCSKPCVEAFLEAQFPESVCSSAPTLACLCQQQSTTSYTLGEAAAQCIIAANRVGVCPDAVIAAGSVNTAYSMCSDIPDALPNTHATLSATIVIPSSGSGIIIIETPSPIPTLTRSSTMHTTTRPVTATSVIESSSSRPSPNPTFATTSFATSSKSSTSTSATSTSSTTPAGGSAATPAISLENGQIIGISVGIAGAIALALIAIFLARRKRKKNFPDMDSSHWKAQDERKPNAAGRMSQILHISPPIFRFSRQLNTQQNWHGQGYQNIDTSQIGVAVSRPRSSIIEKRLKRLSKRKSSVKSPISALPPRIPTPEMSPAASASIVRLAKVSVERPTSKLLPAKPNLTLAIPPPAATRTQSSQPLLTDRTSTMTNGTAFADLDSAAVEGTTWRPPPSDPQSATALFVADKWGNWVLSNKTGGQDEYQQQPEVPPLPKQMAPVELDAGPPPARMPRNDPQVSREQQPWKLPTQSPPAFLLVDPASGNAISTSSVYSQETTAAPAPAAAGRPPVRPYGPASRSSSSSNKGFKNRNNRSNSEVSNNSTTTIDTEFELGDDGVSPEEQPSNLSPVAERHSPSPVSSRNARSPPQIPPRSDGRLGDGVTVRLVPPPRKPDFGVSDPPAPLHSPGFAPPGRFGTGPVPDTPGAYPSPLRPARRLSRPGDRTRNSPRIPAPQMMPLQQQFRPQRQPQQRQQQYPQYPQQQSSQLFTPPQQYQKQYQGQQRPQQYQPRQPQVQPPRLETRFDDRNLFPSPPTSISTLPSQQQQQVRSPHSAVTVSSNASSLLAKRLGTDRAAALALDPNAGGRRQKQAQQSQTWKRQGDANDNGQGEYLSPELSAGMLPMTPGWQPRLTPTRRGQDLYLNVQ